MDHYAVVGEQDTIYAIWRVDGTTAQQLSGVLGPQQKDYEPLTLDAGEASSQGIRRIVRALLGTGVDCVKLTLEPGQYHPRIARPSDFSHGKLIYPGKEKLENEIAIATGQLAALTEQLQRLCQTIHPDGANLDVYGHAPRNLLILACTEVEAHWRGVLEANGSTSANKRFTTNDYVKVCSPLRLHEYTLAFNFYPWLGPQKPFERWLSSTSPTQDLPWYEAYNLVKHNREANFPKASLKHVIQAVAACAVMMVAQYGDEGVLRPFFSIRELPRWTTQEHYIFPYALSGAQTWKETLYTF